jgi:DNA-directed RNA polymerase alpha subunit
MSPCTSCRIVRFLETKLEKEDFDSLRAIVLGKEGSLLEKTIADCHLFTDRTKNCLAAEGIVTFGDLVKKSETDLRRTANIGMKTVQEVNEILESLGLALAGSISA